MCNDKTCLEEHTHWCGGTLHFKKNKDKQSSEKCDGCKWLFVFRDYNVTGQ